MLGKKFQAAQALKDKAEREEKMANALLQNAPVGAEIDLSFGDSEMKLSKNTPKDMEDKNITTEESSIELQGNVASCGGAVGLQVNLLCDIKHIVRMMIIRILLKQLFSDPPILFNTLVLHRHR